MDTFGFDTISSQFDLSKDRGLNLSPMLCGDTFSQTPFFIDAGIMEGSRRQSFSSSESSIGLDSFSSPSTGTASPSTPITHGHPLVVASGAYLKNAVTELNLHPICGFSAPNYAKEETSWMTSPEETRHPYNHLAEFEQPGMHQTLSVSYPHSSYPNVPSSVMNPPLSLAIFNESLPQIALESEEIFVTWGPPVAQTPPRTIAPNATLQPILTSSPAIEPTTPLQKISILDLRSSPVGTYSPGFLPSQHEMDESPFSVASSSIELTPADVTRVRRATSRLTRRQYARKGPNASARTPRFPRSKSGFNCDEIIPQNEFACKYKDCIDKDTGKQKRFKRQEHKKRHEKTVHEKERHNQYKCWVPECKTAAFSRTDNLKSHLQKTHGKKSANARNRYVATQDKNSEFYDPEWVGELTEEGYPILDGSDRL